jgi:hypothetical protein
MTDSIRTGTMLIKDGIAMPESLVVGTEHYSAGWSSVIGATSSELDKQIEDAGWTFFYMAGEIHTTGFGFNDQSRTDRAVAHVIDAVKRENCNCLEITQMRRRSFLGVPYTSLVAHSRHIQRSRRFYDQSSMPVRIPHLFRVSGYTTRHRRLGANLWSLPKLFTPGKTKADYVLRVHPD